MEVHAKDPQQIVSQLVLHVSLVIAYLLDARLSLLRARAESSPALVHLSCLLFHVFHDRIKIAPALELTH